MQRRSYIGITGFMSAEEVDAVMNRIPQHEEDPDHPSRHIMIGVLASAKTVRGEPNKWPGRYPKVEEIGKIFSPHIKALNLIHYATDDKSTLDEQVRRLIAIIRGHGQLRGILHGFQFNVTWPDPWVLDQIPVSRRVLQIGHRALEEVGRDPRKLAQRLDSYRNVVTDVLLDPSGGLGKPFDLEFARAALLEMCYRQSNWMLIGVAGGLSHENVAEKIGPLAEEFADISIDAEGQLRTPKPEDKLDLERAHAYIRSAQQLEWRYQIDFE